ncbi:MAG: carboxypeptidase regulatory-like domain-containing protein [Deltaproteobacteria bacterium]|nr:carboxypeptidase regulatory-like domain-containing protein [Deltaproteobacteria bacterium]
MGLAVWLRFSADDAPPPAEVAAPSMTDLSSELAPPAAREAVWVTPPAVELVPATAARDEDAGLGSLGGKVLSAADNRPVPGAELTLLHDGAVHSVTAARDGSFLFRAPAPGRYELAAVAAEGFADFAPRLGQSPVLFEARAGLAVQGVVVHLTPQITIHGRVVDDEGKPVAAATVTAVRRGLQGSDLDAAVAKTDAGGAFSLQAPGNVLLTARHPDYLGGRKEIAVDDQTDVTVTIIMMAKAETATNGRIVGVVVTPAGEPVEAALVTARPSAPQGKHGGGGPGGATAVTDLLGRFAIPVLVAEDSAYKVVASAEGYGPASADDVAPSDRPITLKLKEGASVTGRVTAKKDGAAVVAFSVLVSSRGKERSARTLSFFDGDGRYAVTGLATGPVVLRIAAAGYAASKPQEVAVPSPGRPPAVADVALEHGGRVHGTVVAANPGGPVAGARVTIEGDLSDADAVTPVQTSAVTDAAGAFSLAGVATGRRTLSVAAVGFNTRLVSGLDAEADADVGPLVIELSPVPEGQEQKTEMSGIGAALKPTKDGFAIVSVVDRGGADRVGLVQGDVIVTIDGTAAKGLSMDEAIERIRGGDGTVVRLTVQRADGTSAELSIVRQRVLY